MIRIRRFGVFNESLTDGDFLVKVLTEGDYDNWIGDHNSVVMDSITLGRIKGLFDMFKSFNQTLSNYSNKDLIEMDSMLGIIKCSDDWFIIIDYFNKISSLTGRYEDDCDKYIYLVDGMEGLELISNILKGLELESKDIIW